MVIEYWILAINSFPRGSTAVPLRFNLCHLSFPFALCHSRGGGNPVIQN